MPDDVHNSPEAEVPSEAQFGLRFLLGVMTAVALFAALAGVVVKQYSPDVQHRLVAFWGLWLAGLIGYVGVAFWQRRQAEREMGPVILQTSLDGDSWIYSGSGWRWLFTICILVFGWYVTSSLIAHVSASGPQPDWALVMTFPVMMVWTSANSIAELLWERHLQFRVRGILWGRTLLLWDEVAEYRWSASRLGHFEIARFNDIGDRASFSVPLAPEDRAPISELMDAKLMGRPKATIHARRMSISQLPLSSVLREAHIRRHYFFLALSVFVGLTLGYLGLVQGTGTREFDGIVLFILYFTVIIFPSLRNGVFRRRSVPIARLFARRDFLGFAAHVFLALGVYYLARNAFSWPSWFGYLFGIAYTYLTITTFGYYLWTQLDLCSDEVSMLYGFRWPWETVTLRTWDRGRGRLILRHKWQGIVAYVLPDQRETVDKLLHEKLLLPTPSASETKNQAPPTALAQ